MKNLLYIVLVLFVASCNSIKVNLDYNKETDFSGYNTYNYYPDMETGLGDLDNKRLFKAMDITLRTKGLLYSEEPDCFINIQSKSFQEPRNSSVGLGVGGSGRNVGGGVSVGIPVGQPKVQQEIRFDFVDAKKDVLFWQAISISTMKEGTGPIVREQKLRELVEKVFAKYPPKTKK